MPSHIRRLLFVLLITGTANTSGDARADQFDAVRALIQRKLQQHETPSIAVAVVRGGQIVWEEAFGWADVERKRAATVHTPYRLGSVSKPITATAILAARDRRLVDLDRPINDYLGQTPLRAGIGDAAGATVRRVLQHMSGLPEFGEAYYRDEPGTSPALDLTIQRYGVLTRPPGEKFVYSNLGYAVLGQALANVSGKSYGDFLHDEVFGPLGMTDSAAPGPHLNESRATGYLPDGKPEVEFTRNIVPAADVFASAHDLARFGLFHLKAHLPDQRAILTDPSIDEMKSATVPMGDAEYGLGWHIRKDLKGRRQVLHGGASAGVDVQFTLVPEEKVCVAVLANVTRHYPGAVTEAITNAILAQLLGGTPDDFPTLRPAPPSKPSALPDTWHGRWVGTVQTHQGNRTVTIWIPREGDIRAQLGDQPATIVRDPRFAGAGFTGTIDGDIGTDDAARRPYELQWDLTLRDDRLTGTVYAMAKPAVKRPLRLGYWVELKRAGGE
jgi:CubicO group peptidase (beta-lactamase class C family)